jgi:DNA-binding response OmpR family regulator
MTPADILIIDDEPDLIELVRYNLEREGMHVRSATDGHSGLQIATRQEPDLVILDLMMPGLGGLEVCKRLRDNPKTSRVPILMLTAKASEADKIVGLQLGADDYLTKPFSVQELAARVKALLRRSTMQAVPAETIRCGELSVDLSSHEVTWGGRRVALTATEFRLISFLASRAGRVLSRDQIIDHAIGRDAVVSDRTIDVHVTSLRKKLGKGGGQIETVRGFGYKMREHADDPAP